MLNSGCCLLAMRLLIACITFSMLVAFQVKPVFGEPLSPDLQKYVLGAYEREAQQGFADTQYQLARMFSSITSSLDSFAANVGVTPDDHKAVHWLAQSAEQGYCPAHKLLGGHYLTGAGVPRDYVFAYKWLNLANAGGADPALLDNLEKKISPEQIAEGQRLSRDWKPTQPLKLKTDSSGNCTVMSEEELRHKREELRRKIQDELNAIRK